MSGPRGRTLAIVQARMTSTRLPGKVLQPLVGAPMIIRQIERIQRSEALDDIVVATSDDASDDELVRVLQAAGVQVIRGPLDDVLARYIKAIDLYQPDVVIRLTGDCPLVCPSVIDLVVGAFHDSAADYASNTMRPTYPDGLDVEVIDPKALREVAEQSVDVHEREHVTLGVYRHPENFVIENVTDPERHDNSHLRWTVDNEEDLDFVRAVYDHLWATNPKFDYADILNFTEDNPAIGRTAADAARNAALDGLETGAMQHGGDNR